MNELMNKWMNLEYKYLTAQGVAILLRINGAGQDLENE